jgi:hypothetical protein
LTFNPQVLTSIHGKRLGLGATGGLVVDHAGTKYEAVQRSSADALQGSSAYVYAGQGILTGQTALPSSISATFTNYGRQTLASGTATAITMEIAAPVAGGEVELFFNTSASEITLGSPTTTITFQTTHHGEGSSLFISKVNGAGTVVKMRGQSATVWSQLGSTAGMTID